MQREDGENDDLAIELIETAVYAVEYRALSREFGGGGSHFQTMADRLSVRVGALAGEIFERETRENAPRPAPVRRQRAP